MKLGIVTAALLSSLAAFAGCGGDDDGSQAGGAMANGSSGAGAAATCQQIFDNADRQCPGGGYPPVGECEENTIEFESVGCRAWADWMSCAGTGRFTCDGLYVDCEAHWQATNQCRAALAATGCVRLVPSDDDCAEPTPYAFSCFGNPPRADCTDLPTGAAVAYFCCPALE